MQSEFMRMYPLVRMTPKKDNSMAHSLILIRDQTERPRVLLINYVYETGPWPRRVRPHNTFISKPKTFSPYQYNLNVSSMSQYLCAGI